MDLNAISWWRKKLKERESAKEVVQSSRDVSFWDKERLNVKDGESLLSSLERRCLLSMVQVGNLKSLPFGKLISYKRDAKTMGSVKLPSELKKLLPVIRDANVWYDGDGDFHNRAHAFRLCIFFNSNTVHCIWVLFAIDSGIVSLEFDASHRYSCNVPKGFTVDSFVGLLSKGDEAIRDFVLENGKLNKSQLDFVRKKGLDGMGAYE